VVYDDNSDAPWENCDGFEHEVETARHSGERDLYEMQGHCYCDGRRESVVITLPDNEDHGIYQYLRERGASQQVAREAVAANRRRTLAQLVEWYSNGWQWFGVRCDFEVLGQDFSASVWGIDDNDYARDEIVPEIADEVTGWLEKAGFTVTGRPERVPYPSRKAKRMRIHCNLNMQNWSE